MKNETNFCRKIHNKSSLMQKAQMGIPANIKMMLKNYMIIIAAQLEYE